MNEDLKRNPSKAFMLFTKVYVYTTNTKKPWHKLKTKEMNSKKFEWYCQKWFFMSRTHPTEADVKHHLKTCPELKETEDNILKNNFGPKWKHTSYFYHIYDSYPLKDAYDFKLLINTIGLRMLHVVNN